MPFDSTIQAFAAAVTDASLAAPSGARGRQAVPDARRFAVYRNNVAVGLIASLEMRYPVARRLVGADFFRAMARAFVAQHKPNSPVLIFYGAEFPDFIAGFAPARELPYLADVARLENAWVESYHAAEATPLALALLTGVDPERLGEIVFDFHPAALLLRLVHPAASIWAAHQSGAEPSAPDVWAPEDALITRPGADVLVRVLPPGGHDFAAALRSGVTLAEAAAPLAEVGIDPAQHLIGLIEAGALAHAR